MDVEEGFAENELFAYQYPDPDEFEAAGLQIVLAGFR